MKYIREQAVRLEKSGNATDLVIGNYVYNKVDEGIQKPISYCHALPVETEFT